MGEKKAGWINITIVWGGFTNNNAPRRGLCPNIVGNRGQKGKLAKGGGPLLGLFPTLTNWDTAKLRFDERKEQRHSGKKGREAPCKSEGNKRE